MLFYSIWREPRCRIKRMQSFLGFQSTSAGCFWNKDKPCCSFIQNPCSSGSDQFKVLNSNGFDRSIRAIYRPLISQSISTKTGEYIANNLRHDLVDGTGKARSKSKSFVSSSSSFKSIQFSDSEPIRLGSQNASQLVNVFVMDTETTGLSGEKGRIIEIAIRDLVGGDKSCFQTLVNPQQNVPNSRIHGITTDMVNRQDVPRQYIKDLIFLSFSLCTNANRLCRMEDLIPILMQYIRSRQISGGLPLFVTHNGCRFDVPFLIKEFSRCSVDIPSSWLFLDTLPLARELMRSDGSSRISSGISLQALRKYYDIPLVGSVHRALADVNLLALILERLTLDLKLTVNDLLERSFKASDLKKN